MQVAEEAARRCFRDSLISKAVRECGKNNPTLSSTSQFIINQPLSNHDYIVTHQKSRNNSGNSNSMDESSSTEEALSTDMELNHSNLHRYPITNITDHHQAGQDNLAVIESSSSALSYLPVQPQILQSHEANLGSYNMEPGSTILKSVQPRVDYTRWLSSRTALPLEDQFLDHVPNSSRLNNSSELQSHSEVSTSMQPTISGASNKLDIRINRGFNQQGEPLQSENNFGYRSFSHGPLMSPNTTSLSSLLESNTALGYAGQYNNSGLISPNNVIPASLNTPLAGSAASSTAMQRLHEYEVPSPRMVLWDFQD